jgi:hypothetical protein
MRRLPAKAKPLLEWSDLMKRYHLHLEKGGVRILDDHEGVELQNFSAARADARATAGELLALASNHGRSLDGGVMVLADGRGRELYRLPLSKVRGARLPTG